MKTKIVIVLCMAALILSKSSYSRAEEAADEKWKSHVELSYSKTSGNSNTSNLAGKFEGRKKTGQNRYSINGNVFQSRTDGETTASKVLADATYDRFVSERAFFSYTAGYNRDKFSGFNYRLYTGPGFGYILIKTEKHNLETLLSALFYHDKFIQPNTNNDVTDDYVAGKAVAKYQWQILDNLKFKEVLDYFVSFKTSSKYFVNSTSSIETKINSNFSLGLAYIVNYQAKPASTELKKTDNTFLANLSFPPFNKIELLIL